jgi:hypothetical protein
MNEIELPLEKQLTYSQMMNAFEKMDSEQKNEFFSKVLKLQLCQEYTLRAMSIPEEFKK